MDFQYQVGTETITVKVESAAEGYQITLGDHVYQVRLGQRRDTELAFTVDGVQHLAYIVADGATHYVAVNGQIVELKQPDPRRAHRRRQPGEDSLAASMPGQITKVLVQADEVVSRGQTLLILEAMKMEIKIAAPRDGRVAKVLVQQGQIVERGQGLIEMINDQ